MLKAITRVRLNALIANPFAKKKGVEVELTQQEKDTMEKAEQQRKEKQVQKQRLARRSIITPDVRKRSIQLYDKLEHNLNQPATSKENKKLQAAILVRRLPIFFAIDQKDLEVDKRVYYYKLKNGYISPIPKQLLQFEEEEDFLKFKRLQEVEQTHRSIYKGKQVFYRQNSKYYLHVDPYRPYSGGIQSYPCEEVFLFVKNYSGEWRLPSHNLLVKDSLSQIRKNLITALFDRQSNIVYEGLKPIFKYQEEEHTTLVFQCYHDYGLLKKQVDCKWVPKQKLSEFLTPGYFDCVAKGISIAPHTYL